MNESNVDVIIPVFNCEQFIGEAIDSILQQTWRKLRVIVVNDGSTDDTVKVIGAKMEADKRIVLLSPGKVGLPSALNQGLEYSDAPYLAFLDADDLWKPNKLEKQFDYLQSQKDISVCFTMIQEFESFNSPEKVQRFRARTDPMKGIVRDTFLGKREIFDKYGYFDPKVEMGEFISWMSPAIHDGYKYYVLLEALVLRRIHDNNMTRNIATSDYLKLIKAHLEAKKKA